LAQQIKDSFFTMFRPLLAGFLPPPIGYLAWVSG